MGDFWIIRVAPQCDACENLQKVRVFSKIIFPIKILFFQNSQNYRGEFSKRSGKRYNGTVFDTINDYLRRYDA